VRRSACPIRIRDLVWRVNGPRLEALTQGGLGGSRAATGNDAEQADQKALKKWLKWICQCGVSGNILFYKSISKLDKAFKERENSPGYRAEAARSEIIFSTWRGPGDHTASRSRKVRGPFFCHGTIGDEFRRALNPAAASTGSGICSLQLELHHSEARHALCLRSFSGELQH